MRPLTDRTPKPALPIAGAPLGAWALTEMLRVLSRVVVNVSHLPEKVEAALTPYAPAGTVEFFFESPAPLGTAGTLRELRPRMAAAVLTYNSDVISDVDAGALLAFHRRAGTAVTMAGVPSDHGDLEVRGGRAVRLIDRRTTRVSGMQFTGVAAIEPDAVNNIPPGPQGLTEAVVAPLLDARDVAVYAHHGYFIDVGTPERLRRAIEDVRDGRAPAPPQLSQS
jgi:NDP-sugar pyrophosphorylase family protein